MNAVTLKALKGSIIKWQKIASKRGKDEGVTNCPLCDEFNAYTCGGCPVNANTGYKSCTYTPYTSWIIHQDQAHALPFGPHRVRCARCKRIAQDEVKFLKSLLPKKGRKRS